MKKIIATLLVSFSLIQVQAQFNAVPEVVENTFQDMFPKVSEVIWKNKLTRYSASFTQNDLQVIAQFSTKGVWLETEKPIEESAVPNAVAEGVQKSKYADRDLKDWAKILTPKSGDMYRVLAAKNDFEKKYLFFNESGRLIKETITL